MPRRRLNSTQTSRFQRLARVMSRDYKVDVQFAGMGTSTDGETIFLPANSDHLSEDGKLKVHALFDHERLHVAEEKLAGEILRGDVERPVSRFGTDARPYRSPLTLIGELTSKTEKMMFNVFEDIRIEHRVSATEIGTGENLTWLNKSYAATFTGRSNFWREIGTIIIFASRGLDIPNLTDVHRKFMAELAPEIQDSTLAVTPADALALAGRAERKIRKLHEEQKAEPEPDPGEDDDGPTLLQARERSLWLRRRRRFDEVIRNGPWPVRANGDRES